MLTAEGYRSYEWYANDTGSRVGVRYQWAGFDSPATFQAGLTGNATGGVDCSGFVSRVWELSYKRNTTQLRDDTSLTTGINKDLSMQSGDIFVNDSHTALLYKFENGRPWIYESNYIAGEVDGVRLFYDSTGTWFWNVPSYVARRYTNITDDFNVYLPYLKTANGWTSSIRVFNLENYASADGTIEFYTADNGWPVASTGASVGVYQTFTYNAGSYVYADNAAAILRFNHAVAVSAEVVHSAAPYESVAYNGQVAGADEVGLPVTMKNYYGWTTDFDVQNIGRQDAAVTVTYRQTGGGTVTSETWTIPPNGFHNFNQADNGNLPNGFLGSAVVSAGNGATDRELVVSVRQRSPGQSSSLSYNGVNTKLARTAARVPSIVKNYYGWTNSLNIQNLGSRPTNATASFYREGDPTVYQVTAGIQPGSQAMIYNSGAMPDGYVGSVVVRDDGYQPLGVVVNQTIGGGPTAQSYQSESIGGRWLWVSDLKNISGSLANAFTIQNLDDSAGTWVNIWFYQSDGSYFYSLSQWIDPCKAHLFYLPNIFGSTYFDGSAIVTSSNSAGVRLDALSSLNTLWATGDTTKAYAIGPLVVDDIEPRY